MQPISFFVNTISQGDCVKIMRSMSSGSVDFVLTDPPYLVNYHARDGRTIAGDNDPRALRQAFFQMFRVLKDNRLCVSFYGWNRVDTFMDIWKDAGFAPVGHVVWPKRYASSGRFVRYQHEQAYLLAKGTPRPPRLVLSDVQSWQYTGNVLHPTQKPLAGILPLLLSLTAKGDIVLDPFAGSGTTLVAAKLLGRRYIGMELREEYAAIAKTRLGQKGGEHV
jgi:site-specific DNA-methyltransferase (adenine-specific)